MGLLTCRRGQNDSVCEDCSLVSMYINTLHGSVSAKSLLTLSSLHTYTHHRERGREGGEREGGTEGEGEGVKEREREKERGRLVIVDSVTIEGALCGREWVCALATAAAFYCASL